MLTIQPKLLNNYKPAFKSDFNDAKNLNIADMDEDSFLAQKEELEMQKEEFENLANDDDFKIPSTAKKLVKGGAIVTTGLLGGMATGWGTKKSIEGFSKLLKTKPVKQFGENTKFAKLKMKNFIKNSGIKFIETKTGSKLQNIWRNFTTSKFVQPVSNFFKKIGNGIKYVVNKIKGISKETWKKVTINTVGTSGGIAAGVNTLKEKNEVDE